MNHTTSSPLAVLLAWFAVAVLAAPLLAQIPRGLVDREEPVTEEEPAAAPLEEVPEGAAPAERLNAIFDNIRDLADVQAEVGEGVVRLTGTVVSSAAREKAEEIAAEQPGIVAVDNRIRIVRDLRRRLAPIGEKLEERLFELLVSLPLLVLAGGVIALFWLLARRLSRWERPFRSVSENRFVRDLAAQVTSTVVFVLGVLLALEILDATALVGAVLGAAGVIGLAVGFAFKDLVENYIASVLLSIRQPFSPGDHVVIGDREGKVVRLTSRATILMTLDGNHLRVPNAEVFKGTILNYSTNPRRRFRFEVGVGVEEDLSAGRQLILEALRDIEGVLEDPEPVVLIDRLGDSSVVLVVLAWMDQRRADFGKARSETIRRVKEKLDREGIAMPEPTYRLTWTGEVEEEIGAPEGLPVVPVPGKEGLAEAEVGDISPETHLDEEIAAERAREEDMLSDERRGE